MWVGEEIMTESLADKKEKNRVVSTSREKKCCCAEKNTPTPYVKWMVPYQKPVYLREVRIEKYQCTLSSFANPKS